jgi:sugar-specific transcriptional regulator TrmB
VDPDTHVKWDELLTAMGRFGFAEKESRLYLLLLRRGGAKVSDLTRDSGVDRVHAYRTLDGMRARGLVQTTAQRPRRYVALPPRILFERSLFERRRALDEDVVLARELGRRLPEMTAAVTLGAPRFQLLTGAPAVYSFLKELVHRTEKTLDVMITPKALRDSTRFEVPRELPRFLHGGGRLRLLVERDPRLVALVRRLRRARAQFPKIEARALPAQRSRVTIADGKEAIVFLVPETDVEGVEETAVWTDNPDFVAAQQAHFEAVWRVSEVLRAPRLLKPRSSRS